MRSIKTVYFKLIFSWFFLFGSLLNAQLKNDVSLEPTIIINGKIARGDLSRLEKIVTKSYYEKLKFPAFIHTQYLRPNQHPEFPNHPYLLENGTICLPKGSEPLTEGISLVMRKSEKKGGNNYQIFDLNQRLQILELITEKSLDNKRKLQSVSLEAFNHFIIVYANGDFVLTNQNPKKLGQNWFQLINKKI